MDSTRKSKRISVCNERKTNELNPVAAYARNCLKEGSFPSGIFNAFPVHMIRKLSDNDSNYKSSRPSIHRKVLHSTWTVYKHFASLIKPMTLHCETAALGATGTADQRTQEIMTKILRSTSIDQDVEEFIRNEKPWARLKRVYTPNDGASSAQSPQLNTFLLSLRVMFTCLFTYFYYQGHQEGKLRFKEAHITSVFATQSAAQKKRYNFMMKSGFTNAFKMTGKFGAILVPALILQQGLEVYWNTNSPISFMLAFSLIGGAAKISLGPKGVFAGSVIGAFFGTIGGISWYAIARLSGDTQEKQNYESVQKMLLVQKNYQLGRERDYVEEVDEID